MNDFVLDLTYRAVGEIDEDIVNKRWYFHSQARAEKRMSTYINSPDVHVIDWTIYKLVKLDSMR
jgi:hypothetical protein